MNNIRFKVLILFGREEQFLSVNQQLLHEIVNTSLQMCANVSATADLSEKADVLEAFFAMMANLVKKVPQLINRSGIDTAAIFQCGKYIKEEVLMPHIEYKQFFPNTNLIFLTSTC